MEPPRLGSDLDLRRLRMFVTVAEAPSMRVAAEEMFITQQAASSAIKELERSIGVELFTRSRRSLAMTAAGEALHDGARALLAGGQQLIAKVRQAATEPAVPFVIGYTADLATSEVFSIIEPVVLAKPPGPISLRPIPAGRIREELLTGEIDLVLRRGIHPPPGLATTVAANHTLRLAVSADHPLAERDRVRLGDVVDYDIVVSDGEAGTEYTEILVSICQAAGFEPRIVASTLQGTPPHTAVIAHPEACAFVTNQPGWVYRRRVRIMEFTDPPEAPVQAVWLPHTVSDVRAAILTHGPAGV